MVAAGGTIIRSQFIVGTAPTANLEGGFVARAKGARNA